MEEHKDESGVGGCQPDAARPECGEKRVGLACSGDDLRDPDWNSRVSLFLYLSCLSCCSLVQPMPVSLHYASVHLQYPVRLCGDCSLFSLSLQLSLPLTPYTTIQTAAPTLNSEYIPCLSAEPLRHTFSRASHFRPLYSLALPYPTSSFTQCSPRADMAFDLPPTSTTNTQATAESCQLRSTRTSSTRQPCQTTVNSLRNIYPTHLNTRLCASRGSPSRSDASRCAYRSENNSPSSSSPPPSSALLSSQ